MGNDPTLCGLTCIVVNVIADFRVITQLALTPSRGIGPLDYMLGFRPSCHACDA